MLVFILYSLSASHMVSPISYLTYILSKLTSLAASGICRLDCSLQKTKFTNLKQNTFRKVMAWILELYRDNPNVLFFYKAGLFNQKRRV